MSTTSFRSSVLVLTLAFVAAAAPAVTALAGPPPTATLQLDGAAPMAIESFSWGAAQATTPSGTTAPDLQEVLVTRLIDGASPVLLRAFCAGAHHATGVIEVRGPGGEPVIRIRLRDVALRSMNIGSQGSENGTSHTKGHDRLVMETLTLAYSAVEVQYLAHGERAGIDCASGDCTCVP